MGGVGTIHSAYQWDCVGEEAEMSQAPVLSGVARHFWSVTQGCSRAGGLLWESGGVLVSGTGDKEAGVCGGGEDGQAG